MTQLEKNKSILQKYIPDSAIAIIAEWVFTFDFKLKIKKSRSSKYGDYRPPVKGFNHQITINGDMNKYAFLVTLVHEIAHLSNWQKHKNKVKPHGEEWKKEYQELIKYFLNETVFPQDIIVALTNYMVNPAASSCSDIELQKALRKYDSRLRGVHIEELPDNSMFRIKNGRCFIKGKKLRKRYECKEVKTNRIYLFSPVSDVEPVNFKYLREEINIFDV